MSKTWRSEIVSLHMLCRLRRPRRASAAARAFTLLLVPHSGKEARRWRIPVFLLRLSAALGITALVGLAWVGWDYLRLRSAARELQSLRTVNEEQARQIDDLARRAAEVEERLNELNELDAQVREMLDLPPASDPTSGSPRVSASRGGPARTVSAAAVRDSFANSDAALEFMRTRLEDLKEKVAEHQRRLAHIPSSWPVNGRIVSNFGFRRSPFGKGTEYHEGVDIDAPYGAPVRATGDGRVIFAGWKSGYGELVVIDHGYGYQTAYGHNSKIKVRVGQAVKRGDVIAYVGSTGRSTGPHLHYEVIYQGKKKNPRDYLP